MHVCTWTCRKAHMCREDLFRFTPVPNAANSVVTIACLALPFLTFAHTHPQALIPDVLMPINFQRGFQDPHPIVPIAAPV